MKITDAIKKIREGKGDELALLSDRELLALILEVLIQKEGL